MRLRGRIVVLLIAAVPMWPQGAFAQLNVLISGGFSGPYEELVPDFERSTGLKVVTGRDHRKEQGRKPSAPSSPAVCPQTW